jgi:hypothetical protein
MAYPMLTGTNFANADLPSVITDNIPIVTFCLGKYFLDDVVGQVFKYSGFFLYAECTSSTLLMIEKAYMNDRIVLPVAYAFRLKVCALWHRVLEFSKMVQ